MQKKEQRIRDLIERIDKMNEDLLGVANDCDKVSKKVENSVRDAVAALEYAVVQLHQKLTN